MWKQLKTILPFAKVRIIFHNSNTFKLPFFDLTLAFSKKNENVFYAKKIYYLKFLIKTLAFTYNY